MDGRGGGSPPPPRSSRSRPSTKIDDGAEATIEISERECTQEMGEGSSTLSQVDMKEQTSSVHRRRAPSTHRRRAPSTHRRRAPSTHRRRAPSVRSTSTPSAPSVHRRRAPPVRSTSTPALNTGRRAPSSGGSGTVCKDMMRSCASLVKRGICKTSKAAKCSKTCGKCGSVQAPTNTAPSVHSVQSSGSIVCVDREPVKCPSWSQSGICASSSSFKCKKSCGECGDSANKKEEKKKRLCKLPSCPSDNDHANKLAGQRSRMTAAARRAQQRERSECMRAALITGDHVHSHAHRTQTALLKKCAKASEQRIKDIEFKKSESASNEFYSEKGGTPWACKRLNLGNELGFVCWRKSEKDETVICKGVNLSVRMEPCKATRKDMRHQNLIARGVMVNLKLISRPVTKELICKGKDCRVHKISACRAGDTDCTKTKCSGECEVTLLHF